MLVVVASRSQEEVWKRDTLSHEMWKDIMHSYAEAHSISGSLRRSTVAKWSVCAACWPSGTQFCSVAVWTQLQSFGWELPRKTRSIWKTPECTSCAPSSWGRPRARTASESSLESWKCRPLFREEQLFLVWNVGCRGEKINFSQPNKFFSTCHLVQAKKNFSPLEKLFFLLPFLQPDHPEEALVRSCNTFLHRAAPHSGRVGATCLRFINSCCDLFLQKERRCSFVKGDFHQKEGCADQACAESQKWPREKACLHEEKDKYLGAGHRSQCQVDSKRWQSQNFPGRPAKWGGQAEHFGRLVPAKEKAWGLNGMKELYLQGKTGLCSTRG